MDADWMRHGNCRGSDPNMFFPIRGKSLKPAFEMCERCPVRLQCLQYAVVHNWTGVWGGRSEVERRSMRLGRRQVS